jgi:hypothetical protein
MYLPSQIPREAPPCHILLSWLKRKTNLQILLDCDEQKRQRGLKGLGQEMDQIFFT